MIRNKIRNIQMDFNFESQMWALFDNRIAEFWPQI